MKVLVIQHNSSSQGFSHFGAHSRPHGIETRNSDFKENLRVEPMIEAEARVDKIHKAKDCQDQAENHSIVSVAKISIVD